MFAGKRQCESAIQALFCGRLLTALTASRSVSYSQFYLQTDPFHLFISSGAAVGEEVAWAVAVLGEGSAGNHPGI
jgi:hypothetical protein